MKYTLFFLLLFLMSCKTVNTVTKIEKEYIRDTIITTPLPQEKQIIETVIRDTIFIIENSVTTTKISIKDDNLKVEQETKDSIQIEFKYIEKEIIVEKIVNKRYIPSWVYLLIAIVVVSLYFKIKKFI